MQGGPPRPAAGPAIGLGTPDLRSSPVPAPGPDDRLRGPEGAPVVTVYADFECPFCAVLELRLKETPVQVCFRHFPVRAKHPRAWAAAQAVEAAAMQDAFWAMHDALYTDQARLEDPHLWARAASLGLDVARFHADAHSTEARERVERDFRTGIRAGVATTPTLFLPNGRKISGRPDAAVWAELE
ncbi:MAG: thioredoxin domain-containing protein [Solirubrobacteraceae bacterium]